jgi:hypothetical protein
VIRWFFFFLFFDTNEKEPFIAKREVQPTPNHKGRGKEKKEKNRNKRERPQVRPLQAGEPNETAANKQAPN